MGILMKFLSIFLASCLILLGAGSAMAAMTGMNHGSTSEHYSDQGFISGMIAHHEGAVAMADELLRDTSKNVDAQVKTWAEDIKKAQLKEIAQMRELLKKIGGIDKEAYAAMHKEMEVMLQEQRQGADRAMAFVELMTPHHAGAISMSLPALLHSADSSVMNLAKEIIKDQTEEIAAFRAWMRTKHSNH